jgi:hypothetical protein
VWVEGGGSRLLVCQIVRGREGVTQNPDIGVLVVSLILTLWIGGYRRLCNVFDFVDND